MQFKAFSSSFFFFKKKIILERYCSFNKVCWSLTLQSLKNDDSFRDCQALAIVLSHPENNGSI